MTISVFIVSMTTCLSELTFLLPVHCSSNYSLPSTYKSWHCTTTVEKSKPPTLPLPSLPACLSSLLEFSIEINMKNNLCRHLRGDLLRDGFAKSICFKIIFIYLFISLLDNLFYRMQRTTTFGVHTFLYVIFTKSIHIVPKSKTLKMCKQGQMLSNGQLLLLVTLFSSLLPDFEVQCVFI